MLNLVIDIGNTRTKVAIFNQGELMLSFPVEALTPQYLDLIQSDHPSIKNAILSSVKDDDPIFIDHLKKNFEHLIVLDHHTPLPIENLYKTPETLGKDRIAAAVGANWHFPNENLLLIDAGTAITYEFINQNNQYLGGFITPGLRMRYRALHEFTGKLPLLEPNFFSGFSGLSTFESISGGIQYGLEGETERIIQLFNSEYQPIKIILTGGDANYFERIVKNYNFVDPDLTLIGLNRIFEFNHCE